MGFDDEKGDRITMEESIVMYQVVNNRMGVRAVEVTKFDDRYVWLKRNNSEVRKVRGNHTKPYFETFDEAKKHCTDYWDNRIAFFDEKSNEAARNFDTAVRLKEPKEVRTNG